MAAINSPIPLLQLALDAAALRHQAIANNIANVGSPGYRAQRVNFEEQLGAARAALAGGRTVPETSLRGVEPFLEAVPGAGLGTTSVAGLDFEVARLAQNTLQYQTLLRAVNRYTALLSTAVNEGRR